MPVVQPKLKMILDLKWGVPAKAWEFISKPSNWDSVDDLFQSSIAYVNSDRRLDLQCKAMYNNSKENDIFINSDGTGDQKGTKADIKLIIDEKPTKNQISLKVKGGEQFAQVAGVTFEKQTTIWGKLGIDVSSAKNNYDKYFAKVDLETRFKDRDSINKTDVGENLRLAASEAYKMGAKQLKSKLSKSDSQMLQKLGDFIKEGAALGDKNIELVKLTGGTFKRAKFGKKVRRQLKSNCSAIKS